jgi:hypothetical protein
VRVATLVVAAITATALAACGTGSIAVTVPQRAATTTTQAAAQSAGHDPAPTTPPLPTDGSYWPPAEKSIVLACEQAGGTASKCQCMLAYTESHVPWATYMAEATASAQDETHTNPQWWYDSRTSCGL